MAQVVAASNSMDFVLLCTTSSAVGWSWHGPGRRTAGLPMCDEPRADRSDPSGHRDCAHSAGAESEAGGLKRCAMSFSESLQRRAALAHNIQGSTATRPSSPSSAFFAAAESRSLPWTRHTPERGSFWHRRSGLDRATNGRGLCAAQRCRRWPCFAERHGVLP
jgi:hypothetical protein